METQYSTEQKQKSTVEIGLAHWLRCTRVINPCFLGCVQRASLGRALQAPSAPLHWNICVTVDFAANGCRHPFPVLEGFTHTHNFVTHNLSHTTCVAGVALGDIDLPALGHIHVPCAWQVCHLWRWIWWCVWSPLVARASLGGTYGTGRWSPLTPHHLALAASTFHVCSRRGTWRHPPSTCVASACLLRGRRHLRHWAGSGGALGPRSSPVTLRHFAWQAWHLATYVTLMMFRGGVGRDVNAHIHVNCSQKLAAMSVVSWLEIVFRKREKRACRARCAVARELDTETLKNTRCLSTPFPIYLIYLIYRS